MAVVGLGRRAVAAPVMGDDAFATLQKNSICVSDTGRQRPALAEHVGSLDVAEGAVLGGAGVLVIVTSLRSDPAKATGIDEAVKTLGRHRRGDRIRCIRLVTFALMR